MLSQPLTAFWPFCARPVRRDRRADTDDLPSSDFLESGFTSAMMKPLKTWRIQLKLLD